MSGPQHGKSSLFMKQEGIQYGLNVRGPPTKAAAKPVQRAPLKGVFGEESDDEGDGHASVNKQVQRVGAAKQVQQKVADMHASALKEDPTVFDYDGVYDDIKRAREEPARRDRIARESKYVGALMAKAQERKMEESIRYERRLRKEQEKEKDEFGDKERFVTAAYRSKLEEEQKWLAEQNKKEEEEQKEDVTKRGDLTDFYRNLLTKNTAFGAKPAPSARASGTAAASDLAGEDAGAPAEGRATAGDEREPAAAPNGAPREESGREDAGILGAEHARGEGSGNVGAGPGPGPVEAGGVGTEQGGGTEARRVGEAVAPPAARRMDESALLSAKERYLARKRAREEAAQGAGL